MTGLLPSPETIAALVKIALLVGGLMTAAAYLVLVERWVAAWVQDRRGPNRVGIPFTKIRLFGLGQPLADGLKIVSRKTSLPGMSTKCFIMLLPWHYSLPRWLSLLLSLSGVFYHRSIFPDFRILFRSLLPGLDVGVLWVFALSSIAVYGVLLGGWASNNKYGFLGGLRSSAQLVAYEIPLGLGLLGVVLAAGSLQLDIIMNKQAETGICCTLPSHWDLSSSSLQVLLKLLACPLTFPKLNRN